MTQKFILTITRTQECKVCVEVPDLATAFGMRHLEDAEEILRGARGVDWETVDDYVIEEVEDWSQDAEDECSADIELKEPIHLKRRAV